MNTESPASLKWINDLCTESYRVNECKNEEDNDEYINNEEEENFIDFKKNYIVLALNQQRKYFLVFKVAKTILNFRCRDEDNIYESSLGFNSELEDKFEHGLVNWLDKLTEGLNMDFQKYNVKKWPAF